MRCLNKERKKVEGYFLLGMVVTCVPKSQVGFIYFVHFIRWILQVIIFSPIVLCFLNEKIRLAIVKWERKGTLLRAFSYL
uniref:hypothetical protein n=1 Tax=Bacillus cytotoxicus TaxID=580165 RepID=UPI00203CC37D